MIHLAPSLYVLQYLDKSGQDDAEIRSRALGYLTKGERSLHHFPSSQTRSNFLQTLNKKYKILDLLL